MRLYSLLMRRALLLPWRVNVNTKTHRARSASKGNNERISLTRRALLTFYPPGAEKSKKSRHIMKPKILTDSNTISLKHTLECGQCFRWQKDDSAYVGVVRGKVAKVSEAEGKVFIETNAPLSFWTDYFDIQRDYDRILQSFGSLPFTVQAIEHGRGLRILRQDPWETLCSYIISSCNNIPRISAIIEKLCKAGNEKIEFDGKTFYAFPSLETMVKFDTKTWASLGAGYRDEWLRNTAQAVADGKVNFNEIHRLSTKDARKQLMTLKGVGKKVADCVLLFGFGKTDAFPVDTWMKKAADYYGGELRATDFGEYAGVAQEYIFYYVRKLNGKK